MARCSAVTNRCPRRAQLGFTELRNRGDPDTELVVTKASADKHSAREMGLISTAQFIAGESLVSNSSRRVPAIPHRSRRRCDLFSKQHEEVRATAGDDMIIAIQHHHVIPATGCGLTGGQHLFSPGQQLETCKLWLCRPPVVAIPQRNVACGSGRG